MCVQHLLQRIASLKVDVGIPRVNKTELYCPPLDWQTAITETLITTAEDNVPQRKRRFSEPVQSSLVRAKASRLSLGIGVPFSSLQSDTTDLVTTLEFEKAAAIE